MLVTWSQVCQWVKCCLKMWPSCLKELIFMNLRKMSQNVKDLSPLTIECVSWLKYWSEFSKDFTFCCGFGRFKHGIWLQVWWRHSPITFEQRRQLVLQIIDLFLRYRTDTSFQCLDFIYDDMFQVLITSLNQSMKIMDPSL